LLKNWTFPKGIFCGKTGYSQKEFTAEKLDIPGRNVL
jgi:hypothetical protein